MTMRETYCGQVNNLAIGIGYNIGGSCIQMPLQFENHDLGALGKYCGRAGNNDIVQLCCWERRGTLGE